MFFLKIKKFTACYLLFAAIIVFAFFLTSCNKKGAPESNIDYYTCGMHPSVKILPKDYNENVMCPICNMKLSPVYKEGAERTTTAEQQTASYYGCGMDAEGKCPHCDLGQSAAKCICGEHSFMMEGQKMDCPVCKKPLQKLTGEEIDRIKGVVSRVTIKGEQIKRAGVKTSPVEKRRLYKEIRTVGRVAYDPKLAIAEEEFISSLKALDKIQEGNIAEIKERAGNLVESSKRKLQLFGLSAEEIEVMEKTRKVHTSLILPEKKMWIYGEVYEYELSWVKKGQEIIAVTSGFPGEEFKGVITSLNPMLDPKTRSLTFRAEVDNSDLKLKPEMYVDIVIKSMYMGTGNMHMVLAIPKNAVLDTGKRKIVWVDKGSDEYEGRIVIIGPEAGGFYPVLKGLSEGEAVVFKANFLIDSQSQITGVAAAAYGGALGTEEKNIPPVHQH